MFRSIVALALLLAALSACRSGPEAPTDSMAVPADFALDLTILSGAEVSLRSEAHLQPSRYVLFADGSLHYAPDPDRARGGDWLPPLTRVLWSRQIKAVWSLAQDLGFADPAAGDEPINFKLVQAAANEIVYLAGFSGSGRRWMFIRRATADQPPDPGMTAFVRHLAQLAWASEQPQTETRVMPKRYDFGPDPYARYRKP